MAIKILEKIKKFSSSEASNGQPRKKANELKEQIETCKQELNDELQKLYAQKKEIENDIAELENEIAEMNGNLPNKKRVNSNRIIPTDKLSMFKVGRIAQTHLRKILESGAVSPEEIEQMQTKEYSKTVFGLDLPLLTQIDREFDSVRYYTNNLIIKGTQYRLCSQWFETPANNDRQYLLLWLEAHGVEV